jgi:hypothetical protein
MNKKLVFGKLEGQKLPFSNEKACFLRSATVSRNLSIPGVTRQ